MGREASARYQLAIHILEVLRVPVLVGVGEDEVPRAWQLTNQIVRIPEPRVDEAVPYLHRAIALDPTALSPLRSLVAIELSKGHLPAARQLLQRAYALDPDYADVAPLLGVVLAATGEGERATQYLADPKVDRLAENDPSGSLVVALGNAYMSLGRMAYCMVMM